MEDAIAHMATSDLRHAVPKVDAVGAAQLVTARPPRLERRCATKIRELQCAGGIALREFSCASRRGRGPGAAPPPEEVAAS
jgi:hypothetical protein